MCERARESYLFITLSCSQEATSPRSCKHTETQASVSSNPGNNKWSPHTGAHTHARGMPAQTHPTRAGCQRPDSTDKTTSSLHVVERQRLQACSRTRFPANITVCKPALPHHKRAAHLIPEHDKLIFCTFILTLVEY